MKPATFLKNKARLLLVADGLKARPHLERILNPHYEVMICSDGQTALSWAQEKQPDLILSALKMPQLDGFGLLRALRAEPLLEKIPFIFLCAKGEEELFVEAESQDSNDFIIEPFNEQEILARVRIHLKLARVNREAENALRESEHWLALALKSGHAALFDWEIKSDENRWSDELLSLYGLARSQFGGRYKDWLDCLVADDREAVIAAVNLSFITGKFAIEFRIRRRDTGEIRWMDGRGEVIFDQTGKPDRMVGLHLDMTERKNAELAQQQSEERFRKIFENAATGIAITDLEGRFIQCNAAYSEIVGYSEDELRDINFYKLIHPDDLAENVKQMKRLVNEKLSSFKIENRYIHKNGQTVWAQKFVSVLLNERGMPAYLVGLVTNITERKKAEEALLQSEARYRTLFTSLDEGFCVVKVLFDEHHQPKDYCFLEVNPVFERLTGIQNAAGRCMREAVPDNEEYWLEFYSRVALTGQPVRFENQAAALNRWFDVYAFRVGMPEEHKIAILFHDITDRRKMEQDLKTAHKALQNSHLELEKKVQERTKLAEARAEKLRELASALTLAEQKERNRMAQILHDHLQQLLVAIKIGINRTKTEADGRQIRPLIDHIDKLADEAVEATRSFTVELSPPILRDAGLLPAVEWLARWFREKHGLIVHINSESELKIPSDDVRIFLFQSIRELLLNVIKHSGTNQVWIRLHSGEKDICVEVIDQGKGFDPDELLMRQTASGFGLFHVFERLDLLGGHVKVESEPGQGAHFFLSAPAWAKEKKPLTVPQILDEETQKAIAKARPPKIMDGNVRVLVADDHKILRQGLMNMLNEMHNIKVVGEAADGQEAVQQAAELLPDVVIMDISMPKMNGIEATEQIKARYPGIQIIGLSLHDSEDVSATIRRAGASAYLTKSGPIDDLVETIRNVVATKYA